MKEQIQKTELKSNNCQDKKKSKYPFFDTVKMGTYKFYKFIATSKWRSNIPVLLFIWLVICTEIYCFFGDNQAVYKDRLCCYSLIVLCGVLLFIFPKNKKLLRSIFFSLLLCSCIFVIHTALLYGNSGGFSIENLMHLSDIHSMLQFFALSPDLLWKIPLCILLLTITLLFSCFSFHLSCYLKPAKNICTRLISCGIAGISVYFLIITFYPANDFIAIFQSAVEVNKYRTSDKKTYLEHGIKITDKTPDDVTASSGKNLVLIILESTELAYLDEKKFPGLLPHLQKYRRQCQSFENMQMAKNATLTFGAMFSMMTGSFLTAEYLTQGENSHTKPYIGSKLSSFPQILNKADYQQYFLAGCSGNFAGTENFVKKLKYNETWFGVDRSLRESSWEFSLRDSRVFEKAWEFFQAAADRKKPFNITILTIDAHGPHGFYDPAEPPYPFATPSLSDQLYNAMYASDHALGKFLTRIEKHPASSNTCVVIVSDHLAHHYTVSTPLLAQEKNRRLLFLVKNSVKKEYDQHTAAMTFDIAPTILEAMGVKHDYIFPLGESLYSKPDQKRLSGSEQQTLALRVYTKIKSTLPVHLNKGIEVKYHPFPHFAVGKLAIPLRYGGICDELRENDWYILPIPQNKIFNDPNLIYCSSRKSYNDVKKSFPNHIFLAGVSAQTAKQLGGPERKVFVLGLVAGNKSIIKFAQKADDLRFLPEEIKKLTSPPCVEKFLRFLYGRNNRKDSGE